MAIYYFYMVLLNLERSICTIYYKNT